MNSSRQLPLYTKALFIITLQAAIISFLLTTYHIEIPLGTDWLLHRLQKTSLYKSFYRKWTSKFGFVSSSNGQHEKLDKRKKPTNLNLLDPEKGLSVFTSDQLALFDGTRKSNPVYLALLGRVYNVEKGRKFYAPPGGYSFFSGKDASRAFVTGDFTPSGLTDDVFGLSESELLSIDEWISFYEKEYELVGLLEGTYWTSQGKPTAVNKQVNALIERARAWKEKQVQESEVFPPCNSEWQKETGGRVWCTNKSGGIKRDWVGVPRRLFVSKDKSFRCTCVKNFGSPLSTPDAAASSGNRGDLDNPNLKEYEDCPELANSCRIPAH